VARASRVVVGQYREGGGEASESTEDLIGADEAPVDPLTDISTADTLRLDDATLREIFGGEEEK
jgi:hypothetical protein